MRTVAHKSVNQVSACVGGTVRDIGSLWYQMDSDGLLSWTPSTYLSLVV